MGSTIGLLGIVAFGVTIWLWWRFAAPAISRAFSEVESWKRLLGEATDALFVVAAMAAWLTFPVGATGGIVLADPSEWLAVRLLPVLVPALLVTMAAMLLRWRSIVLLAAGPGVLLAVLAAGVVGPLSQIAVTYGDPASGIPVGNGMASIAHLLVLLVTAIGAALATRWSRRLWFAPIGALLGCLVALALLKPSWLLHQPSLLMTKSLPIAAMAAIPLLLRWRIVQGVWTTLVGADPAYPWRPRHEGLACLILLTPLLGGTLVTAHRLALIEDRALFSPRDDEGIHPLGAIYVEDVVDLTVTPRAADGSPFNHAALLKEISRTRVGSGTNPPASKDWVTERAFWRGPESAEARALIAANDPLLDAFHRFHLADVLLPRGGEDSDEARAVTWLLEALPLARQEVALLIADGDHTRALDAISALLRMQNPADHWADPMIANFSASDIALDSFDWYLEEFRDNPEALRPALDLVMKQRRTRMLTPPYPDDQAPPVRPYQIIPESSLWRRGIVGMGGMDKVVVIYVNRLTLLQTRLAIELHRHDHSAYPASLEQLVPQYLPAVPRDRTKGLPLVYTLGADGVYTVNVNGEGEDDTD